MKRDLVTPKKKRPWGKYAIFTALLIVTLSIGYCAAERVDERTTDHADRFYQEMPREYLED